MPNHWLAFDLEAAGDLREALNDLGGRAIAIYYPLVIAPKVMEYSAVGRRLRGSLQELEEQHGLDALWLRVSGFGSMDATARMLLRYVHFARAMHEAGVPVIAERSGTLGLALLAFGVVGGIEQGVTFGEGFDANTLTKDKGSSSGFMPAPRIYLAEIGAFVKKSEAERLFADRSAKNRFACQRPCCKRGVSDMIHDPRRHFLACRADEIGGISRVPTGMRADHYLETWLGPASDRVGVAAKVLPRLIKHRRRLDDYRTALSDLRMVDKLEQPSISEIPTGGRLHRWGV
jgi:hypothetical protein